MLENPLKKPEKNKRTILERRLDRLAWLLEGSSMCAAVAVIKETLCIAANDFYNKTTDKNKHLIQVQEIINYFKEVQNGKLSAIERDNKRDALMISICKSQVTGRNSLHLSPELIKAVVCKKMLLRKELFPKKPISEDDPQLIKYFEKNLAKAYMAFGYGMKIYNTFIKIEKSIEGKDKNKKFNSVQLEALKKFKHEKNEKKKGYNSNILFLPRYKEMAIHAEAQILDKIVKMVENNELPPQEIYIGISKKCCHDCHLLLRAAQKKLGEYNIILKFGGAHDKSFEANWGYPPFLLEERGRTREQTKKAKSNPPTLSQKIRDEYIQLKEEYLFSHRKIKRRAEEDKNLSYYDMGHSGSSSEVSDEEEEVIKSYQLRLNQEYLVLEKYGFADSKPARVLLAVIKLCEKESVKRIFKKEISLSAISDSEVILNLVAFDFVEVKKNSDTDFSDIDSNDVIEFITKSIPPVNQTSYSSEPKEEDIFYLIDPHGNRTCFIEESVAGDGNCFFHAISEGEVKLQRNDLIQKLLANHKNLEAYALFRSPMLSAARNLNKI